MLRILTRYCCMHALVLPCTQVRNMNLLVWGVDLVEEQLLCTAGERWQGLQAPKRGLAAASCTRCPASREKLLYAAGDLSRVVLLCHMPWPVGCCARLPCCEQTSLSSWFPPACITFVPRCLCPLPSSSTHPRPPNTAHQRRCHWHHSHHTPPPPPPPPLPPLGCRHPLAAARGAQAAHEHRRVLGQRKFRHAGGRAWAGRGGAGRGGAGRGGAGRAVLFSVSHWT